MGAFDPHPRFGGWHVVGAAFVTQAIAIGFTIGTVAVFAAPLAEELGATATHFNLGISLFTLVMNLSMPVIGWALTRTSISNVMTGGAFALALGLYGVSDADTLGQVGICFGGFCAVGMAMLGPMPSSAAVANWFEKIRGRALGIANVGAPTGPMVIAPLAALAIGMIGWRTTLQVYAVLTLVITLPVISLAIRDRPSDLGQFPDGEGGAGDGSDGGASPTREAEATGEPEATWETAELARSRDFWCLALGVAPIAASGIVLGANSVPYMVAYGASVASASLVVVFQSAGAIAGPLVFGTLADRIHPRSLFLGLTAALCAALGGLALAPGFAVSLALFTIAGLVGGSMMPVYGAFIGRLFGAESFGQVMGLGALVGLPLLFIGPVAFGRSFDVSGGYGLGLVAMIVVLAIGGLCFAALPSGAARRRVE